MTEIELQDTENPLGLKLLFKTFLLTLLDTVLMEICFAKNHFEKGCIIAI